jgi:hypothetical protein
MPITNRESGTSIEEIADGIYRVSTPVPEAVIASRCVDGTADPMRLRRLARRMP